jgi:hypothetical protein
MSNARRRPGSSNGKQPEPKRRCAIFTLYEQHRSALTVARLLDQAGRTTKRHRANNGNVREGKQWTKDAVLRVLRIPIYAGHMADRTLKR